MVTGSTLISQLPTGTINDGTAVFPLSINMTGTPQTIQASLLQAAQFLGQQTILTGTFVSMRGYIQENSAQITYVTGTSYRVEAGAAEVNGTLLAWSSALVRSSLTLTSGTMNYVYMGASGTQPFLEESTTVPVWAGDLNYYKKTGDGTRRCIGFLNASNVNTIRKFLTVAKGRDLEQYYTDGVINPDRILINAGGATGTWQSFSLTNMTPAHATHTNLLLKMIGATSGDDGIVGVAPINQGASLTAQNGGVNFVRGKAGANGANVFFGSSWLPIVESQTYYYRLEIQSGAARAEIDLMGSRITR